MSAAFCNSGVQVRRRGQTNRLSVLASICCAAILGGCTSLLAEGTSAGAGIAGASIAHGVTNNAGVATGIGLGVQAAARAGIQYAERKLHQAEQDRIAATAGILSVGAVGQWQVAHDIPIEADEQGEVTVSRKSDKTNRKQLDNPVRTLRFKYVNFRARDVDYDRDKSLRRWMNDEVQKVNDVVVYISKLGNVNFTADKICHRSFCAPQIYEL